MTRKPILASLALGAALLGALGGAAPAQAQEHRDHWRNRPYNGWFGGYRHRPPVVYGSPYRNRYYVAPRYYAPRYYPPPVVYSPGVTFGFTIR